MAANVYYSTPDEKLTVHVSEDPYGLFYPLPVAWLFHQMNPLFDRIDGCISRIIEAGLINEWKKQTWRRMKQQNRDKIAVVADEEQAVVIINMDHLMGTFFLLGALSMMGVIVFLAELAANYYHSRRNDDV